MIRRIARAFAMAMLLAVSASAHSGTIEDAGAPRQILVMLRLGPEHLRPGADYGGGYGDALARSARQRIARRVARHHGLTLVSDWPMPLVGVDCFVMAYRGGQSADMIAARISLDPDVAWSQPIHVYQTMGDARPPNDPLFAAQPAARQWRLADLHRLATGKGVTVAIIDSRIDRKHPDLGGQVATTQDFVLEHPSGPELHGTGIAGIVAAKAGNGLGIAGIAPSARLMGLRACWQPPARSPEASPALCDSLSLAKALHFAVEHNAGVINLSLAGPPDPLLDKLLEAGLRRGISIVAAFDRKLPGGGFPASFPGVIAVSDGSMAPSRPKVYIAPGRDVPTTQPGGRWYLVAGSSYAAAHVSGLIALVRERHPLGRGTIALVSERAEGGAIDACATLRRSPQRCDGGVPSYASAEGAAPTGR